MDKKDFIFPGVILGLVLIISIGLLLTHGNSPSLISTSTLATSTISTTTPVTPATTTPAVAPTPKPHVPAPAAYYPYGSVTLYLNQPAVFKDGIGIRPIEVLEDSRCPMGVFCIQAGSVKISLRVSENGVARIETIQTGQSITVGGDTVAFESVQPARPKLGNPLAGSYRFTFSVEQKGASANCYIGGCSAELCTNSPNAVSNCIYTPAYACYKTATCERQANGVCGWTQTKALSACIAKPPKQ